MRVTIPKPGRGSGLSCRLGPQLNTVTSWTYADIWETTVQSFGDRTALTHGSLRRSWREFGARADGMAQYLLDSGAQHQDKVAFYLHNSPHYSELMFACSKASLVHVNTNYRYGPSELTYLFDNSDAAVVVFHGSYTETVASIMGDLPNVRTWIWVDDETSPKPDWAADYEVAVATQNTGNVRCDKGRSGDDLLFMYTGGTTGMPKGVMWRQGDLIAATDSRNRISLPVEPDIGAGPISPAVAERNAKPGPPSLPACPLMHGTGLFNSLNALSLGGSIVTLTGTRFDVVELLDTVQSANVRGLFIVGDAFAKPILAALDAEPDRWDISSLRVVLSSGVMWSEAVKAGLILHNPKMILVDSFGSSEAISMAASVSSSDSSAKTATFSLADNAVVLTDEGQIVEPGSTEIGKVALRGHNPIGYYKDPEKSAATFPVIEGHSYSIPGDFATVASDGTITLLGRGSVCINTGGEKVFPEEVEEALKGHPNVDDAIVVGIPHERFGESVNGVVVLNGGELDEAGTIEYVKSQLADYKAPRRVFAVPSLDRGVNGKVNYARWKDFVTDEMSS